MVFNKDSQVEKVCKICGRTFIRSNHSQVCFGCLQKIYDEKAGPDKPRTIHRCHDCGRPTPDYRCSQCWRKLRIRKGLPLDASDDYWAEF